MNTFQIIKEKRS